MNGIRDLLVALTQRLHSPGFEFVSEYMHCFIAEENEHMWYFARFCNDYAGKIYDDRAVAAEEVPEQEIDGFLIFARALVFEELVDIYNRKMSEDERLHPFARQINRLHHLDEVRHIAYGRLYVELAFKQLQEKYPESRLAQVREAVERFIRLCVVRLYPAEAYRDTGLERPVRVRKELLQHPARVEYNRQLAASHREAFRKCWHSVRRTQLKGNTRMPSVADRLRVLIVESIEEIEDGEAVTSDAQLADMGMDSVCGLDLLLAMEEEFKVEFPEEVLTNEVFASHRSLKTALKLANGAH